jgi:hypothetical protein
MEDGEVMEDVKLLEKLQAILGENVVRKPKIRSMVNLSGFFQLKKEPMSFNDPEISPQQKRRLNEAGIYFAQEVPFQLYECLRNCSKQKVGEVIRADAQLRKQIERSNLKKRYEGNRNFNKNNPSFH